MNIDTGTRFGPYEIVSPLAAGGMGEVYKARDTRLDRTVAVKILPRHLSADPELRQRFEREARAISALAHPHICTLFDVGSADGIEYIVMEYLEGQTLSERIAEGPMAMADVVRVAIEIADALEKAHRMGIVHRDLKPGNVILTKAGAKLLDFGLAKWISRTPAGSLLDPITDRIDSSSDGSNDPTQRYSRTVAGTLLGTVPYMAPEQLDGKAVDARTDIFAFGAIVYEMATGTRAFNAGSQASLIAAIIHDQPPPISRMRVAAPARLDQIIRTCLAKDPGERFQSSHDVRLALEWLAAPEPETPREKRVPWVVPAVLGAALAIAVLAFVAARRWPQLGENEARMLRFAIPPPPGAGFPSLGEGGGFAVSPDGRAIAFVASTPDGRSFLWLRPFDTDDPEKLEGTEGAAYPFWSPDSKSVAFFSGGKLKRLDVPRGAAQTICDATGGRGGTWNAEGVILFSPSSKNGLYRVSAGGGVATEVTSTNAGDVYSHRWPVFLPDGNHFLFLGQSQTRAKQGLYAGALDSKEVRLVMPVAGSVAFAAPDRLYFVRDGVLIRQPFDPNKLETAGEPSTIADNIVFYSDRAYVPVSASAAGVLAYRRNAIVNTRLAWYSRDGRPLAALGAPGEIEGISLSPDETKIAFGQFDPGEGMNHIVVAGAAGAAALQLHARQSVFAGLVAGRHARRVQRRSLRRRHADREGVRGRRRASAVSRPAAVVAVRVGMVAGRARRPLPRRRSEERPRRRRARRRYGRDAPRDRHDGR